MRQSQNSTHSQHDGGVDEPAQDGDQLHGPSALHLVQDGGGDAGEFP